MWVFIRSQSPFKRPLFPNYTYFACDVEGQHRQFRQFSPWKPTEQSSKLAWLAGKFPFSNREIHRQSGSIFQPVMLVYGLPPTIGQWSSWVPGRWGNLQGSNFPLPWIFGRKGTRDLASFWSPGCFKKNVLQQNLENKTLKIQKLAGAVSLGRERWTELPPSFDQHIFDWCFWNWNGTALDVFLVPSGWCFGRWFERLGLFSKRSMDFW